MSVCFLLLRLARPLFLPSSSLHAGASTFEKVSDSPSCPFNFLVLCFLKNCPHYVAVIWFLEIFRRFNRETLGKTILGNLSKIPGVRNILGRDKILSEFLPNNQKILENALFKW